MSLERWKVSSEELRSRTDPDDLPFETTEELASEKGVIGQERALRALEFGLQMHDRGYNVYVSGAPGTGRTVTVKSIVKQVAETQPPPDDWCYVNNFQDPDRPKAVSLPAGKGREFQRDMARLITSLREELPKVFQSQEYQEQLRLLEESLAKRRDALTQELEDRAKESGFLIQSSRLGIAVIPLYKGKPMDQEQLDSLEPRIREEIERKGEEVHAQVHTYVQQLRSMREETNRKIEELNLRVARYTSEHAFERVREKYSDLPKALAHVQEVQKDAMENVKDFFPEPESPLEISGFESMRGARAFTRYSVNLMVDNSGTKGAPFVEEVNPTYNNLVGRIERKSQFGTLYTDFTLIKAGSLLQANGGYLLVNALDLLRNPFSWEAVKRISKNREIKIEDIGEAYGFAATSGLKPEPIPIQVRIILVGNPYLYGLLQAYDEDFAKIFKVKADFDVQQARSKDSALQYARLIARLCREKGLLHFDRGAVAAVLDQASRWVDHKKKFSLQIGFFSDLVRESDYWARHEGQSVVSRKDVEKAIQEKIFRSNLIEERLRELIAEGTLMVDVDGALVGQVNGISVHDLGDFTFGRPSRITARVFLGQAGIVNIEREAKLSGKTHNKGVMILSGYLGGQYGRENPVSLTATLCFEQSYGEVEGDSASAAELLALLSGISNIPLRQDIAVTGSVNQKGEFQAIGAVNEKIEGYYATCKALRLTGKQGVIIPRQNVKHLMLDAEVIDAASAGQFTVYAVERIDEAIEIMTGRPAGERQPDGAYPEGTLNAAVVSNLSQMVAKLGEFGGDGVLPDSSPVSKTTDSAFPEKSIDNRSEDSPSGQRQPDGGAPHTS